MKDILKVREVKEQYSKVCKAMHTLQQEAFEAYISKEIMEDSAEQIEYAAKDKVDRMMYNKYLDMCVAYSENYEATTKKSYKEELEEDMNIVSRWTARASSEEAKFAFGECLKVLTGAWLLEKLK